MTTGHQLDTSKKFVVLGPDERIWFFAWESSTGSTTTYGWQAYSKGPGDIMVSDGTWSEDSVFRFLTRHSRKLTDSDRIDLYLYLHKGGIEIFFRRYRKAIKET